MTYVVQAAIGETNKKALTHFKDFSFNSFFSHGQEEFGVNEEGIFLLNENPEDTIIESEIIFSISDFSVSNFKRIRYIYIGIECYKEMEMKLSVSTEEVNPIEHIIQFKKGLQRKRVPISRQVYGRYWTIQLVANKRYKLDSITAMVPIKHKGFE